MKKQFKLRPELEGMFEVINATSPVLHSRIGDVDFRTMTLEQAGDLINSGTRYLKKVKEENKH